MNWKKKLGEMRSVFPQKKSEEGEKDLERKATVVVQPEKKIPNVRDIELEEIKIWDQNPDFQKLIHLLKIKPESSAYYRLRECFYFAGTRDVEHSVDRFGIAGSFPIGSEEKRITDELKKRGYESEAYNWWMAAQPDGMKYATYPKEKRLENAHVFATKAGMMLERVLEKRNK